MAERHPPSRPHAAAKAGNRLAASLLDRLIDLDPDLEVDPQRLATETPEGLRASLRRDLEILLNTRCLPTTPPAELAELHDSLISLGIDDFFATSLVTARQREAFARGLQARIALFERGSKISTCRCCPTTFRNVAPCGFAYRHAIGRVPVCRRSSSRRGWILWPAASP